MAHREPGVIVVGDGGSEPTVAQAHKGVSAENSQGRGNRRPTDDGSKDLRADYYATVTILRYSALAAVVSRPEVRES